MPTINDRLIKFALACLSEMRQDGGIDIDGGWAQDKAEELQLLVRVMVTEPCVGHCYCAEYYDEFPQDCLRYAPEVKKLIYPELPGISG